MAREIKITIDKLVITGELNTSPTADKIWENLPFQAKGNLWGEEIYFAIPVNLPQAPDATDLVQLGDLGYWPVGKSFCVFYGMTPMSQQNEIRAASKVNIFGKISSLSSFDELKKIITAPKVTVERA